ncbi:ABC transporter ATP-binding protein [Pseudoalteromonas luteoviolacea]|uniref:ABC transporter ATP-binding protein n=1 Tax=Pseudoalteromonas luteoviolacea TaxID=43657 RepID=UPI001B395A8F|nr:ABC transporter ATP-binding protein [Pseudoalteromonas luteoviolacea]MBQ4838643.1 ABC transporter ATP-binding protein [Pseudoalteromonas luteoviolacea]
MYKLFEKITNPFPNRNADQPPNSLYAFCRHYSRGMEYPLIIMSICAASLATLEVVLFSFMGTLVDWMQTMSPSQLLSNKSEALIAMAGITVIGIPILVFVHSAFLHQSLLGNYPMSIRWLAHRYLLKQSMSFYQDDYAGRIAAKLMQTSLAIREAVMKLLDVLVYIVVYFGATLVLIGSSDLNLLLPLFVWLLLYVGLQFYFLPRLKQVAAEQANARSEMTGRIVDSYTNISTVKLFSYTRREEHYAKSSMDVFMQPVYRQMRLVTSLNVCIQALNYLLVFTIAALSLYLWSKNVISAGEIAIAISLSLRLNGMSQWIMWEISSLFENIGTVVDGMNTLSRPVEVTDSPNSNELIVTAGAISFDNVTFAYKRYDENLPNNVFSSLSLKIKSGEKIGIVGRSGSGKSTLVNLLLRFYDIQNGAISIDGQNINDITQESLRKQIAMVTQDTALLHRSIRDNVLYGRPDATEQELKQAISKAQADTFIKDLEDSHGNQGLEAQVGERGVKLSGGQRQRIAIARVLLKDAPILILDEATSALDSESEHAIQASLDELMQQKTVIAIAHRLSTIAQMDRLIVLEQGVIVEQGSHRELLAKNGIYAKLWAHQTGGFIGVD